MKALKENRNYLIIALALIVLAAISRFIPHPYNFTAVGAMALFSGASIRDKRYAFLLPISAMFFTDIFIGFHFSILPVYACFAFTVWIGIYIKERQNVLNIGLSSLISSLVFFLITNLPLWYLDLRLYPMTFQGTLESYKMAMPFFKNQILGDLFYNAIIFGSFYLAFYKQRILQSPNSR